MEAVRRSCIEFVESVDKVILRAANQGESADHTEFDKAVVRAMQRLASVPAIHRLRGRVREASDLEVVAAMTVMAEFAKEGDGVLVVRALIHAATESGKPDVAAKLRALQSKMVKQGQQARNN